METYKWTWWTVTVTPVLKNSAHWEELYIDLLFIYYFTNVLINLNNIRYIYINSVTIIILFY